MEFKILISISLNQRLGNSTCGKLLLGSTQGDKEKTKRTKITLRLSNKYDIKHLNHCSENSETFQEEKILSLDDNDERVTVLENNHAIDVTTKGETNENLHYLQDSREDVKINKLKISTSDGELEELDNNVSLIICYFHVALIIILRFSSILWRW